MQLIHAPSRARRALILLAVAGLVGFTGVVTGVRPASAGPLSVSSFIAQDSNKIGVTDVWTSEAVTLTVTASGNIGSDTLEILDPNFNVVRSCPAGWQTCSTGLISHSTPGEYQYIGEIVAGGQVVSFLPDDVTWNDFPVFLQASQTTLPVGQAVTLTATTSRPVDYSPWDIEVIDLTDGHVVCDRGGTATCPGTVTENVATTHKFAAFICNHAPTSLSEVTNIRSQSAGGFVTWSNDGWQISLTAPAETLSGTETVTATTNMSVTPTKFYIEIFDETTGQEICNQAFNTACTNPSFTPSRAGDDLVAFVSLSGTALPPSGIEASSNVVHTVAVFIQ
jgi:hypothetical protein